MHTLKIDVPDELYDNLKKYNLLYEAKYGAIDGLINLILVKINKEVK
jgi:hypothetical protein